MDINEQIKVLKNDILDLYLKRKHEVHYEKIDQLEKSIAQKLKHFQELSIRIKRSQNQ